MEYDDFKAFEHTGWEHVVQAYEDYFGRLTAQSHGALLDALRVGESRPAPAISQQRRSSAARRRRPSTSRRR
jgi:hypothetical protein